jgi:hypothetical protein
VANSIGYYADIAGVAGVDKGDWKFSIRARNLRKMEVMNWSKRSPFATVHDVIGPKIIYHGDAEHVGEQLSVPELDRVCGLFVVGERRREMRACLAVKPDNINDISIRDYSLLDGFVDDSSARLRDELDVVVMQTGEGGATSFGLIESSLCLADLSVVGSQKIFEISHAIREFNWEWGKSAREIDDCATSREVSDDGVYPIERIAGHYAESDEVFFHGRWEEECPGV